MTEDDGPRGWEGPGTPQGPYAEQGVSGPPPPPSAPQPGFLQPPYGQPAYGQPPYAQNPYGQPPYAQNPYGQPPYAQNPYSQNPYGQNPYGQPGYGYGHTAQTNGFAIASLCCSIGAVLLIGVPALLGVIFGFVGRSQIARSNGTQKGGGLALAGIIIGLAVLAFWILLFVAIAIAHPECSTPGGRC
jgi:hypothetical protein